MTSQEPLILYIEPNITCAKLMELLISRINNYQIIHTTSCEKAIDIAIDEKPDIIMTEMQLSNMTGVEFLSRIREHKTLKHIPVLAVSANAHKADIDYALHKGLDAYIIKPFILKDLYETVRRFISKQPHSQIM